MSGGEDPLDLQKAFAFSDSIQLVDISFLETSIRYVAERSEGNLRVRREVAEVNWMVQDAKVSAAFQFTIWIDEVKGRSAPPAPLAVIEMTIRIRYKAKLPPDTVPDDLRHFVGFSGFLHVWPYARAEVQLLSTKIGLPPLTLPVVVSGAVPSLVNIRPRYTELPLSDRSDPP